MNLPLNLPILPNSQQRNDRRRAEFKSKMLHEASRIGGSIFGPVENGGRREFFCLDEHTWVWHEEWTDKIGQHHAVTTRYDVRPSGIVKSQADRQYQALSPQESSHLSIAMRLYLQRIRQELPAAMASR